MPTPRVTNRQPLPICRSSAPVGDARKSARSFDLVIWCQPVRGAWGWQARAGPACRQADPPLGHRSLRTTDRSGRRRPGLGGRSSRSRRKSRPSSPPPRCPLHPKRADRLLIRTATAARAGMATTADISTEMHPAKRRGKRITGSRCRHQHQPWSIPPQVRRDGVPPLVIPFSRRHLWWKSPDLNP